jgi:hypothetical protein
MFWISCTQHRNLSSWASDETNTQALELSNARQEATLGNKTRTNSHLERGGDVESLAATRAAVVSGGRADLGTVLDGGGAIDRGHLAAAAVLALVLLSYVTVLSGCGWWLATLPRRRRYRGYVGKMHLSMVRNSGKKIRAIEPTHTYHVVKVYYIQTAKKSLQSDLTQRSRNKKGQITVWIVPNSNLDWVVYTLVLLPGRFVIFVYLVVSWTWSWNFKTCK